MYLLVGFILGTVLGSFVRAEADRLALQTSLRERSYCLKCRHKLAWYDLFPVLSYIFLKSKCRYCGKKIPVDNLIAEIVMGVLVALLLTLSLPADLTGLLEFNIANIFLLSDIIFKLFALTVFAILFLVDLKVTLLPDVITYPVAIISSIYLLISTGAKSFLYYQDFAKSPLAPYLMPSRSTFLVDQMQRIWEPVFLAVVSGLVAAGFFALLIIVTKGKGMGWGDVKYVFALGLILGFPNLVLALFLAFVSGAVISLLLIVVGKKGFGQTIPFGPFLSLGAVVALLWGREIINWYITSF